MEVLNEIADAELLELSSLEFVRVYQELDHILVVYILHERVLAQILQSVQDVGVC